MFKISIQQEDGICLSQEFKLDADGEEPTCLEVLSGFERLLRMYFGAKQTVDAFKKIEVD